MRTRTPEQRLLAWLQDAYAMEQEAATMLKAMAGRLEHYPELRSRIGAHVAQTHDQAERLDRCIGQLGGTRPVVRSLLGDVMASVHAAGNALMDDEVAKGLGISYAFEHKEAAAYRSLVTAAREAGQPGIAGVCEAILEEEIEMADWLREHQEDVILAFLRRERTEGEHAKR